MDVARVWDLLHNTAAAASVTSSGPEIAAQVNGSGAPGQHSLLDGQSPSTPAAIGNGHLDGSLSTQRPQVPTRVALAGRNGLQMLLLPPPQARDDPLAVVDLCRAAEVSFQLHAPHLSFITPIDCWPRVMVLSSQFFHGFTLQGQIWIIPSQMRAWLSMIQIRCFERGHWWQHVQDSMLTTATHLSQQICHCQIRNFRIWADVQPQLSGRASHDLNAHLCILEKESGEIDLDAGQWLIAQGSVMLRAALPPDFRPRQCKTQYQICKGCVFSTGRKQTLCLSVQRKPACCMGALPWGSWAVAPARATPTGPCHLELCMLSSSGPSHLKDIS